MIINEDQNGEYSIANDGLLQMDSMFDLEIVATIKSESNWGS